MQVHLVDGTYELFRYFYAMPSRSNDDGEEIAAARGVVGTVLGMLEEGATHLGVATDHVIESWRNDLWPTYKDGSGIDPTLFAQFPIIEDALRALGVTVWAMVEDEADDALAAAAAVAAADERVERVLICTPDKDLGQAVGGKVVQLDRRKGMIFDADGIEEKFGVRPESIPDYLALVGDSADGFPGLLGWGAKSAAAVLHRYGRLEEIPDAPGQWDVSIRGARNLASTLALHRADALLFRTLATLRTDCEVGAVDEWRWDGPTDDLGAIAERLDDKTLVQRASRAAAGRTT
jgi:5'-3' exonuclease